jgi:uncharacterized protein (TIGR02265 family)
MPADRKDLEARLAAATPHDTVRGVVFNAIFSVVKEHADEVAARKIDVVSGKGWRTEFFTYPVADYLNIIWNAADLLEGQLGGVDPVFYKVGARAAELIAASMLGKTLLALAAGGGARQLLTHMPGGYRATVSYGERTVTWVGEKHARYVFTHDFLVPPFHAGVLAVGAMVGGGKNVKATGRQTGPLEAVYDVTWE